MVGRTLKAKTARVELSPPRAEDHGGAGDGVGEELVDAVASGGEEALADGRLDDEDGEDELEAETPGYGAPADGAAVGGEGVGEANESDEAE